MEIDFSLREWEILRFFGFIARNEKNTKMEERDSKKPNISPDSFLVYLFWIQTQRREQITNLKNLE